MSQIFDHTIFVKKSSKINFLFLFQFIFLTAIDAQNNLSKWQVQINIGVGRTFHYNPPIILLSCSGCSPFRQKAKNGQNYHLNFYRKITKKHEFSFGFGLSKIKFWESGYLSISQFQKIPYTTNITLSFANFNLGHRWHFIQILKSSFFIENSIFIDHYFQDSYSYIFRRFALSWKFKLGFRYKLTPRISIVLSNYYKTAISAYNRAIFHILEEYYPFDDGGELGVAWRF